MKSNCGQIYVSPKRFQEANLAKKYSCLRQLFQEANLAKKNSCLAVSRLIEEQATTEMAIFHSGLNCPSRQNNRTGKNRKPPGKDMKIYQFILGDILGGFNIDAINWQILFSPLVIPCLSNGSS